MIKNDMIENVEYFKFQGNEMEEASVCTHHRLNISRTLYNSIVAYHIFIID